MHGGSPALGSMREAANRPARRRCINPPESAPERTILDNLEAFTTVYDAPGKGNLLRGVITMPQVKCSVSNCEYWRSDNNCGADLIMIEIDRHADKPFNAEFAGESFDTGHKDTADKASATCCHTFEPRHNATG